MMNKRTSISDLLLKLTILVITAMLSVSCSKGDDKNDKGGGGVVPDPDIPTLSEIKYDLSPKSVIVPEAATKKLSNVDTLGHKLTLPVSAGKPEVGQCLIFNTPTKQLPDGLLANVKEVKETSNGYEIVYEDAQLKDAFKNIEIPEQYIPVGEYVEHVYDANGKEVNFSLVEKTRASGMKDFQIVLPEIGWEIDKGLELTPKMTIDMAMRYVFMFGDYELSYAGVKLDAEIELGADLNGEIAKSTYEKKFHLLTIVCGAIPIGPVLLTPSIDIQGVFKVEGKITLEAAITYKRTLHTSVVYQKGAGLSGTCNLDPESPEDLNFTFGPKFEGSVGFGMITGGNIGVFGKTLAVRSRLNGVLYSTISGKLDMAAFTGSMSNWLTPYDTSLMPLDVLKNANRMLEYAKKWDFLQFEALTLALTAGFEVGWDLTTLGHDVASTRLPEMKIPITQAAILPQVKINEKDFMSFDENDVTLLLHHTDESWFDNLAEFKAEFKRVNAKPNESPITKYFDFDDEKRNLLVAEIPGVDVKSTAKATLNGEDDYEITVYMCLLGLEIPIFEATAIQNSDFEVQYITVQGNLWTVTNDGDSDYNPIGAYVEAKDEIKTSQKGKGLHIVGTATRSLSDYGTTATTTVTLDIDDASQIMKNKSTITNLEVTLDEETLWDYADYTVTNKINSRLTAANIPQSADTQGCKYWSGNSGCITDYTLNSTTYYPNKTTSGTQNLKNDPQNNISVLIFFKNGASARAVIK